MIVLPADHFIRDTAGFQRDLAAAATAAEQTGALVTIGIKPTWACPGFGYIEVGDAVEYATCRRHPPVERAPFREKPPGTRGGIFRRGQLSLERGDVRLDPARRLRELSASDSRTGGFCFAGAWREDFTATLDEKFPHLPKISIDYAIMENAARVLVLEAALIGTTWEAGSRSQVISRGRTRERANCELDDAGRARKHRFQRPARRDHAAGRERSDRGPDARRDADLQRHEAERIKQMTSKVAASCSIARADADMSARHGHRSGRGADRRRRGRFLGMLAHPRETIRVGPKGEKAVVARWRNSPSSRRSA